MIPPTIAPMFADFCSDDASVGPEAEDGEELLSDEMLGLERIGADDIASDDVGCEMDLTRELQDVSMELEVVDASTAFGTARRVSVPAFLPQAIYSYSWSGPLTKRTVEQDCADSLKIVR